MTPYKRTELEKTAYTKGREDECRGTAYEEEEKGRKRGPCGEKGRISRRELPTRAAAAQLFIWKPFEDGLVGFF